MSNPLDNDAIDNMTMQLQLPIKTYLADDEDLISLITHFYQELKPLSDLSNVSLNIESEDIIIDRISTLDTTHGLDQLITSILHEAASINATDVHIENHNFKLKVFYRVNQRILKAH